MLKKLYNDNKPMLYDLKDEFKNLLKIENNDSNLKKWEKYKSYKVDRYRVYGIDCDVSLLAVTIYQKAWLFLKNVNRPTKQYEKATLDKIGEFSIFKKNNIEEIIPSSNIFSRDNTYICYSREYKYQLILDVDTRKEYYRGDTMTSFSNIYNHYKEYFIDYEDIKIEIEKLAKNYHTIGNMIPVPAGFNTNRAGTYAIHDYWDLTMKKIKEWCANPNDDAPLNELLHKNTEAVKCCEKWLFKFQNNWNEFVEQNYLVSFVGEKKDDNSNYIVNMFWKGHDYSKPSLPSDMNEFLSFLKLLNTSIETRSNNILDVIK